MLLNKLKTQEGKLTKREKNVKMYFSQSKNNNEMMSLIDN